jgi:hypothetical protein
MKLITSLFFLVAFFFECSSQEVTRTYSFPTFTWTIKVPAEFTITVTNPSEPRVFDTMKIDQKFIEIAKDKSNRLGCSMFSFDSTKLFDWHLTFDINNKESFRIAQLYLPKKIDSFTTNKMIDGIEFKKFHLNSISFDNVKTVSFVYAALYRGYYFMITAYPTDENTAKQFEKIVAGSRIEKSR